MIFHNAKKGLFLIGMICFSFMLWAEQIETINISGLKRTKEDTLLAIIGVEPGDRVTPDMTGLIEQKMRKSGIFQEDITVELTPGTDGQILNITAYDRWTLLGIPFFAASSGDMRGGAFLMDTNLGGRGNMFVTSLLLSQRGDALAFFLFRDPTFLDSSFSFSGRAAGGRSSLSYTSLDEEETWEDFYTTFLSLGATAGYDISERVSLSLGMEGAFRELDKNSILPPDEGEGRIDLTLDSRLAYDGTTVYPLFYEGVGFSVSGNGTVTPGNLPTWALSGEARAAWRGGDFFQLQISGRGGVTDHPFDSLFQLGGSAGSLTLPSQKIASDRYLNGELKGEFLLVKMGMGYLTAPLYYEGGYLRDYQEEDQLYQGAGGGIRFYLDKVALPALGLDYRYNLTTATGGVSFFMGMSY